MQGLWLFIFYHDDWHNQYIKNCTMYPIEWWNAQGERNIPLGLLYVIMGIWFEVKSRFIKIYQILFIAFIFHPLFRIDQEGVHTISLLQIHAIVGDH